MAIGPQQNVEDYRRRLGDVIWTVRTKAGLSQKCAAESANISLTWYGMLERGEVNPTLDVLLRLCEVLGTSPAELLAKVEKEST